MHLREELNLLRPGERTVCTVSTVCRFALHVHRVLHWSTQDSDHGRPHSARGTRRLSPHDVCTV